MSGLGLSFTPAPGSPWTGLQDEAAPDRADKLTLTRFTATNPSRLSKAFTLKGNTLVPHPGGNLIDGHADRIETDIAGLVDLLTTLGPQHALSFGVAREASARVVTSAAYDDAVAHCRTEDEVIIARTRDHFDWPAAPGVFMGDYDAPATGEPLTREELLAALAAAAPALATAATIWRPSASSCIHVKGGAELRGVRGQRLYLPVLDASDIERAGKVLFDRLWLAGYGRYELSKSGAFLTRSPIDASVFQPERLDFCGGAECGTGLEQRLPAPMLINGSAGYLDTRTALPDLTGPDRAVLAAMKDSARAARAAEAAALREIWIAGRVDHAVKRLPKEQREEAKPRIERAYREAADGGSLGPDVVIHIQGMGERTVAQILAKPTQFHAKLCRDPLEPGYQGNKLVGWINTKSATPYIRSQAHGGQKFVLATIAPQPESPSATPAPTLPAAAEASAALDAALTKFFDEAADGASPKLGIRGAAGLGKTTRALTMAYDRGLVIDHYVPTHKLAQEQADRLPAGAAIAIRGRTHTDDDRPPLCVKADAADALQAAGFGRSQQRLLCGKPSPGGGFPCPYAAGCGYHAQFKSEATIRFYAHEWLSIGLSEDKPERAPDVAVVDETFSKVFEDCREWRLADLGEWGGAFYLIGDAIRTGTLNKDEHLPPILFALASRPPPVELPIHPEMSAGETISAFKRWKAEHPEARAPYEFLECVKAALNNGETSRFYATDKDGATTIRYAGLKALAASAPAWLFLDASLNPAMVQSIKPGTEIVEIEAARNVTVVQITDAALGKGRLADNAARLSSRLAEFAERLKANNPNGAVIGQLDFLELAKANGQFKDLPDGHWLALRGLNTIENADWLLQIGRNEPPVWAVERSARCWFAGDPDLKFGTAKRESAWLTAKDGTRVQIPALTTFSDARCQAILEGMREQESLQGIDRLRLVHAVTPKTVYLLSNLPLPGIRPDLLVTMDKLLLPGRLAEVMLRDKAITGQAMLAKRHPDLFENEKAAKEVLARLQSPIPLLVILIGKRAIEEPAALVAQDYRAGHQRGGKPRRALLYETADPASLLAALHGEPVTLCESAEAPEAQPVTAAAPIETTTAPPPVVSTVETTPPPAPENPVMPELNPSTDPVVVTPPGVGNIRWWLGCAFDADWETPMAPHFGMECETRFTDWRVWFADGNTTTVIEHEPKTASEFWGWASGLTGAKQAAPIRGVAA